MKVLVQSLVHLYYSPNCWFTCNNRQFKTYYGLNLYVSLNLSVMSIQLKRNLFGEIWGGYIHLFFTNLLVSVKLSYMVIVLANLKLS